MDIQTGRQACPRFTLVAGLLLAVLTAASSPVTAQTAPSLGNAQSFAVLGGSTVTNTGTSVITGDVGVSPGSAVVGFPPGVVTSGSIYAANAIAAQAQISLTIAYNAITPQACTLDLTGQDLGGKVLTAGVYCFNAAAQLTGPLILDAQGNANAVFIFKVGSALTTASSSTVQVINGGTPCNVFWQIGSSATLGTATSFAGNILALTSITLTTGAQVVGRALARNGAVTLDTNNINRSLCAAAAVCPVITLTPATLPNGSIGVAYNQTITGSGGTGPYVFTVTSGTLPAGLTLTAAGVLAGTPTTNGTSNVTIRGTDANGCFASVSYAIVVGAPVPTLAEWAMIGLAVLLALSGFLAMRRRTV